ncbi:diacylglycerol kinase [Vibrio sp. SCSIO 43136]|uniref:diacylglycerol kinase n=1 Tax=Vibrio sp. SCSIO 43136 TaxID=2819101 RepID=UPI00207534CF|nr:diacylglycerol kinase [Vibrio sp. SCSIO 43136]USD67702.1 diacylglycerol kinase [Vibrio sp. SCSIO 43136]
MKPGATGITRILHATRYSMQGLVAAWKNEAAIRQEVVLLAIFVPVTFFLPVSKIEQVALVASLVLILIVELLNSAIEAVVDRIGPEKHELSGRAKDIGSAAVFVALCLAGFTWLLILFG